MLRLKKEKLFCLRISLPSLNRFAAKSFRLCLKSKVLSSARLVFRLRRPLSISASLHLWFRFQRVYEGSYLTPLAAKVLINFRLSWLIRPIKLKQRFLNEKEGFLQAGTSLTLEFINICKPGPSVIQKDIRF